MRDIPVAELRAWVQLSLTRGIGPQAAHSLLRAFGSPRAVLDAGSASLASIVGESVALSLKAGCEIRLVDECLDWADSAGHHLLTWDSPAYPRALLQLPDPPICLYYLGRLELLQAPSLAVVGSRNATPQGRENARAFARALGMAGLTIVSGLALGIDAAAHEGGLETPASSIAVLGTGIDRVYPAANRKLAHRLAEAGGLLSEFPVGTAPTAGNFPRRNRLISGLARGCLVIEAALSSGSLITARLALEQGREVFAVPGSIHSPFSKGPHRLIRDGAKLVETAQDVLEELTWAPAAPSSGPDTAKARARDSEPLLAALGHDPVSFDALAARAELPAERLAALLLELELAGELAVLPGGRYQRLVR